MKNNNTTILNEQMECFTLDMLDKEAKYPSGTAYILFQQNIERFVEGVDYFQITKEDLRKLGPVGTHPCSEKYLIVLTSMGYLMLMRALDEDASWNIHRTLVTFFVEEDGFAKVMGAVAEEAVNDELLH